MKKFYKSLIVSLYAIYSFNIYASPDIKIEAAWVENKVGVEQISGLEYKSYADDVPSFPNSKGYVYTRVTVSEPETWDYLLISYSLIDSLKFFVADQNDIAIQSQTGQFFHFDTRLYPSSDFVFPIEDEHEVYYFEFQSHKPIVLPIKALTLTDLITTITINDFFFGTYTGIVLVMILYNLVIFLLTRDRSYLYYILYLLTLGLAQAALFGYTDRFLFPDSPYINGTFTVLSGALVGIASVFFIINFLHLKEKSRLFLRLLYGVVILDLIGIGLLYLGFQSIAYNMVNTVALVGSVLAIIVAVKLVRQGYKPANFFLIAWSVFLLSVIIFALKDISIIPYNPLFRRSMLFGSTIEIILLSVALADRINKLRKEKEESQAEALRMARENERIIKEQNIELEKRVEARTMELQEANEELQVTLDNLKDTQTQLVDAEKMASLGQLTAGIAHEINNPINFITSNIKPLKLDLLEVYQIIERFASLNENATEEELKEAKALLDELDYSYLKDEIESLVSGISDGANRTSEIVRGLRTFSRLDEDVVKPANLNEGLDSTLVLLKNKTKDTIEIVRDYQADLPDVECYPGKLNQAFMNILNNGIYAVMKKNHPEGEKPTLTLKTTEVDKDHVSLHLIDNGIGMDEQTRKKMFDPFFTTKEVGEGTGLGMSIVFKIVDKHGGKLDVKSEPGVGTEFIITLPKRQPNEFS